MLIRTRPDVEVGRYARARPTNRGDPLTAWVADYEILRPLDRADDEARTFVARPPARRADAGDQVLLRLLDARHDAFESSAALARAVAGARAPHVGALIELGRDATGAEPVAYLAAEYSPLGSLAGSVSGPPALSVAARLELLAGAAAGAHELHEAGLVHGDITPASVLRARGGILAPPAPSDAEPGATATAQPPERLETLDPAVVRGEGRSRATDLWAMGATVHLVLTGGASLHPGLAGDDPLTAAQRVLFEPPVIDPSLPADHAAVIGACLRPDPADRPPSAAALADQLHRLAGAA